MLDPFIDRSKGDIAVNVAGEQPPFHPHITAPYLLELLESMGHETSSLRSFITIRDPRKMLWSYYKFFKPDMNSNYNYSANWQSSERMPFERWIMEGRVGSNPEWLSRGPESISPQNFTPLSLEAYALNRAGERVVNKIFQLEDMAALSEWLSESIGGAVRIVHVNKSDDSSFPELGQNAIEKIRREFPYESSAYGV